MNWRSIPVIGDWVLWFSTKRALREVEKQHDPAIKAAEKSKKEDEIGFAYASFFTARDEALEPLRRRNSAKAMMKAAKLGIPVPRYTQGSEDWNQSMTDGQIFLTDDAHNKLRREIREEQRSNYEEFRKWATLAFALAGFGLGLASWLVKQKQPDPCARNYYRNDAGACVFALTPPPQVKSVQTNSPNIPAKPIQTKKAKKPSKP